MKYLALVLILSFSLFSSEVEFKVHDLADQIDQKRIHKIYELQGEKFFLTTHAFFSYDEDAQKCVKILDLPVNIPFKIFNQEDGTYLHTYDGVYTFDVKGKSVKKIFDNPISNMEKKTKERSSHKYLGVFDRLYSLESDDFYSQKNLNTWMDFVRVYKVNGKLLLIESNDFDLENVYNLNSGNARVSKDEAYFLPKSHKVKYNFYTIQEGKVDTLSIGLQTKKCFYYNGDQIEIRERKETKKYNNLYKGFAFSHLGWSLSDSGSLSKSDVKIKIPKLLYPASWHTMLMPYEDRVYINSVGGYGATNQKVALRIDTKDAKITELHTKNAWKGSFSGYHWIMGVGKDVDIVAQATYRDLEVLWFRDGKTVTKSYDLPKNKALVFHPQIVFSKDGAIWGYNSKCVFRIDTAGVLKTFERENTLVPLYQGAAKGWRSMHAYDKDTDKSGAFITDDKGVLYCWRSKMVRIQ